MPWLAFQRRLDASNCGTWTANVRSPNGPLIGVRISSRRKSLPVLQRQVQVQRRAQRWREFDVDPDRRQAVASGARNRYVVSRRGEVTPAVLSQFGLRLLVLGQLASAAQ